MHIEKIPGSLKRFSKTARRYQATFHTPLDDLDRFVECLFTPHKPPNGAQLIIHQVVFTPRNLNELLDRDQSDETLGEEDTIETTEMKETLRLLRTALADWVDFAFIPQPRCFELFADHDEFTTVFSADRGPISATTTALTAAGYRHFPDYRRTF